jgi:DNA-binding XRE family transcriptional regulator
MNKYKLLGKMAENDYSQRKLAKELKVSKTTINSWVNNNSPMPLNRIVEVCQLLNITDPSDIVNIFLPELTRKSETK